MANEIYKIPQAGDDIAAVINNVLLGLDGNLATQILNKVNQTIFKNENLPNDISGAKIADKSLQYEKTSGIQKQHKTGTVTIPVQGWTKNSLTISGINGVTDKNTIIVTPAGENMLAWQKANLYCAGQGIGTLTFKCRKPPESPVLANLLILD